MTRLGGTLLYSTKSFIIPTTTSILNYCSFTPLPLHSRLHSPIFTRTFRLPKSSSVLSAMETSGTSPVKELPRGFDTSTEEEFIHVSNLLQEFTDISTIDKAWTFPSENGSGAMFSISQPNLLANKARKSIISSHISANSDNTASFQWSPFPIEITGVSSIVPSPSGLKLLVIRNPENDSPTRFEIWSQSKVEKEFQINQSIHGSVYTDGWFEGISWNSDESLIAYVAEEAAPVKPSFTSHGYKTGVTSEKDCSTWKGQGYFEEDWGETYAGKRQPALFVIDINSGEVSPVNGIERSISVGQVVWAPQHNLVFVGWPSDSRKLGMKYCYNRPCALYGVKAPLSKSKLNQSQTAKTEDTPLIKLTQGISSAFSPRFSPNGKFLAFLSAKSCIDSGAHSATNSLHRIDWPSDGNLPVSTKIVTVVPVIMCGEEGSFPGLYCFNILKNPWLPDGISMILTSIWHSSQAILEISMFSGNVFRISPSDTNSSWSVLALDRDNIIAVCSSLTEVPQIKYGYRTAFGTAFGTRNWEDISSSISKCSEKVSSLLSSRQLSIIDIPVKDSSENLTEGAKKPYEAIFVSSKSTKNDPLVVILHGGPHSSSLTSFSKSLAFLSSLGYSLLIVNYRGSLGFGEEALQSLPGNIGSQDVNDVITAIDQVIEMGLADPSNIAVLGGSHGGFLTTHLIGQAPQKFAAAVARNPVCNLSSMVATTDIPEWCYVESFGSEGKNKYTEAPSLEDLTLFHNKSPISHIDKVKAPLLLLLGAKDLRVPFSNGLQYGRALKEKGGEVKIMMFPDDTHGLDRPQTDFESFVNIGVWFRKYCK